MAPLWFASNSNQHISSSGPHPQGGRIYHDASRVPPNVPGRIPPFQGAIPHLQGYPQHMGNQGQPSSVRPFPSRGGPMHHMPQVKGQPLGIHGPAHMRLPHFRAGDRPHHPQAPPDLHGHPTFSVPRIHRPMPPPHHRNGALHGMNRGMPPQRLTRQQNPMHSQMGTHHQQHQISIRTEDSLAVLEDLTEAPLRELQNQNFRVAMQKLHFNPSTIPSPAQDAATDAAEILLGLRAIPSPPPPQDEKIEARLETPTLESLPDEPFSLPSRLSVPEDESKLNSMHCFLRSELLELFVVETSKSHKVNLDPSLSDSQGYKVGSASGRVGLRCVHCAQARLRNAGSEGEAPMAVFYPKSISELYRLVTSWQRVHLRKCRNLPPSVRERYEETRQDKSRGKTQWWVTSAGQIGLVDCPSKAGGIRFAAAPNGLTI